MKHFVDNSHIFEITMKVRDNLSTNDPKADLEMMQDSIIHFINDSGDYDILSFEIKKV
jgi:hypothetical protein